MDSSVTKILNEIKILDFTNHYSGDITSMFLSDFGADVSKLVNKKLSTFKKDAFWNRNKKLLNYSDLTDLDKSILNTASVLIHDFQIESDEFNNLTKMISDSNNTNLIVCHISAFPSNSNLKNELMIDELVVARAGEMRILPGHGKPGPKYLMHPITSVGCGINSATAIVSTLISNIISKKQIYKINSTLIGGLLLYASNPYQGDKWRDFAKPYGGVPFYSSYECKDGFIQLACIHSGFSEKAAIAIDMPEILFDPEFESIFKPNNRDRDNFISIATKLYNLIAEKMKNKTCDEWSKIFEEADVPYNKINNLTEAINDPQILHNKLIFEQNDKKNIGKFVSVEKGVDTDIKTDFTRDSFSLPLEGFKSLEITNVIAGPVAGRILTNLGVEVIKMEPPNGEISRPLGVGYFQNLNRNKKGISVNTKTEDGKEIARSLIKEVDIFLENMRPGAAERVGLGKKDLNELNPGIIQTHIAAYGHDGPYVNRPGLDPIAQSITGLQIVQGGGEAPVFLGMLAPTDFTAGGMAALGTIVGLYNRIKNNSGSIVNTNLLSGGMLLNAKRISDFIEKDYIPKFVNKDQNGVDDFNRAYETSDGWIYFYCKNLTRLNIFDFIKQKFNMNISDLESFFHSQKSSMIISQLNSQDMFSCIVTNPREDDYDFLKNPVTWDLVSNKNSHPSLISLEMAHNLYNFGLDLVDVSKFPDLGEHNNFYLSKLGYSEKQINEFYKQEIIFTED